MLKYFIDSRYQARFDKGVSGKAEPDPKSSEPVSPAPAAGAFRRCLSFAVVSAQSSIVDGATLTTNLFE